MNRMKLMLTIVDRGDGLALAKLYAQNGVQLHLQIAADGTATSELMDLLGLTHRERDLLVGFGDAAAVDALLAQTGPLTFAQSYACSSAAGGLRMMVSGLARARRSSGSFRLN